MRPARVLAFLILSLVIISLAGCGSSSSSPPAPPAGDFALSLSPQSIFLPIEAGNSTVQITITAINNFSQPVTASISGLPTGVTTSPASPFSVTPGSPQVVVFSAAAGTPVGVQNVTVQGNSGTLNHTAALALSTANPSYAYVSTGYANQPPYNLTGFAVDPNTGALTTVAGAAQTFTNMPVDIAAASETGGAFVFALYPNGDGTYTLASYRVDAGTGALTPLQTINYPAGTMQSSLAVHPSGTYLYVMQAGCVLAYLIDPASGNLTQSSCSPVQLNASLVVVPPGNFAYQVTGSAIPPTSWFIFSVNQADGSLTLANSYSLQSGGGSLFTDPQGRAIYQTIGPLGPFACGSFAIWSIDPGSGALTNLRLLRAALRTGIGYV